MNPSQALALYGSDKVNGHHYGAFYDSLFRGYKDPIRLLEIGVLNGQSLKAWRKVLPNSAITGIDIVNWNCDDPSIKFIKADIKKVDLIGEFEIIIDDSSHDLRESLYEIINLTKNLTKGGIMVIEDIQIPDTYISAMLAVLPKGFELQAYDFRAYTKRHDDFIVTISHENIS